MPSPHHITRLFTAFSAEELATATVEALVSKEVLAVVVSEPPLSSFSDIGQFKKEGLLIHTTSIAQYV
jgi:hypothetical protein